MVSTRLRQQTHHDAAATTTSITNITETSTTDQRGNIYGPRNKRRQMKKSNDTAINDDNSKSLTQEIDKMNQCPPPTENHEQDDTLHSDIAKDELANEINADIANNGSSNKENNRCNQIGIGELHDNRMNHRKNTKKRQKNNKRQYQDSPHNSTAETQNGYDKKMIQEARRKLMHSLVRDITREGDKNNTKIEDSDQNHFALRRGETSSFHLKIVSFLSLLTKQQKFMFDVIQNHFDKAHARHFFTNLLDVVVYVIQFEVDIDHDDGLPTASVKSQMIIDHHDEDTEDQVDHEVDGDRVFQTEDAIQFLIQATQTVQVYLNGVFERRNQKEADLKLRRSSYVVDNDKPLMVCIEVYEVAFQLHNSLAFITAVLSEQKIDKSLDSLSLLQQRVIALCETWWLYNGNQREYLIVNVLPLLVQAVLDHGNHNENTHNTVLAKKSNKSSSTAVVGLIKRLYNIRTAINAIDFDDEESNAFCTLLQRLVSLPACLNSIEGKHLLSFLLSNDVILIQKIHSAIRVQIPNILRSTILKAYGSIYLEAWKATHEDDDDCSENVDPKDDDNESSSQVETTEPSIRSQFELIVLQDYMYAVIHAASPSIVKSLMILLEPFHSQKKNVNVESMLYRMYNPIIWRSLKATNAVVRINATSLFAEVFPLVQNRSAKQEKKKILDQTQLKSSMMLLEDAVVQGCQAVQEIMIDKDHRVRISGAHAMASILVTYWDVVPPDQIRRFFNYLLNLAADTSSPAVRVSSINAVTLLLETKSSHAVLRSLLPNFGNLIHDKNEKVRSACVRMLIRIKKINGIKYYDVVPVTHLTARLAAEGQRNAKNAVASLLTSLMLNSYLPQQGDSAHQLQRTIKFVLTDPSAAKVFYANIYKHIPLVGVTKLAAMLLRCLHSSVETEQHKKGNGPKRQRSDSVQSLSTSSEIPKLTIPCLANMSEIICILWQSVEKQLIHDEKCSQFLLDEFSGPQITRLLSHYERKATTLGNNASTSQDPDTESMKDDCYRICASVLRCAGRLPSKSVQGLVPYIASVFRTLSKDGLEAANTPNLTSHTALLCLWGMTSDVAATLSTSIQAAFEHEHELLFGSPALDSKKRKSGRNNIARENMPSIQEDLIRLPVLQPEIALKILSDILAGGDPSSNAARDSLITLSKDAYHSIEVALTRGTKHAEKLLAADVTYSYSVRKSDANFVVNVCECYGRFILHKEASVHRGLEFSENAEQLLHWTTQKVLPAFAASYVSTTPSSKSNDTPPLVDPFRDLNISSIAPEQSFLGVYSPVATGPPKRRSNLNQTPLKLGNDDSFLHSRTNRVRENVAARYVGRAVAVSLLYSSCLLFSEWLAIGCAGAHTIGKSALEWAGVFHSVDVTDDDVQDEIKVLFPAFLRLATYLIISSSDASLLHLLLTKFHDFSSNNDLSPQFKKCISVLLSANSSFECTSPASVAVACILSVSCEVSRHSAQTKQLPEEATGIVNEGSIGSDEDDQDVTLTFHQLIHGSLVPEPTCSLCATWEVLMNHRWGCVAVCELLLKKIDSSNRDQQEEGKSTISNAESEMEQNVAYTTTFYWQCLWALLNNITNSRQSGKKSLILQKEVLHLVRQKFQSEETALYTIQHQKEQISESNDNTDRLIFRVFKQIRNIVSRKEQ